MDHSDWTQPSEKARRKNLAARIRFVGLGGLLLAVGALLGAYASAPAATTAPGESPVGTTSSTPAPAEAPSVRGSWVITPNVPDAPFQALAAFGAGGIFITTGSDQAGTGIGEWVAQGTNGFVFSYRNFHFGADGKLSTITTVDATGTFDGDTLTGTASQSVADAAGTAAGAAQTVTFTGKRMVPQAP